MSAVCRAWLGAIGLALIVACSSVFAAPCAGFIDVDDSSPFCASVEWMKNRAVTSGCSATVFCPNDAVTRLQMAAFLYRFEKFAGHYVTDANGAYLGKWTELDGRAGVELLVGGRIALVLSISPDGFTAPAPRALFETVDCTGQPYTFPKGEVGYWGRYYAETYTIAGKVHAHFWADLPTWEQSANRTVRSGGSIDGSDCHSQPFPVSYNVVEFVPTTYLLPSFVPPFKLH